MVTGAACGEAVELARHNPGLQVGLHLTLVQGSSLLDHGGCPSLTHRDGTFPNDPLLAGMRMFFLKPISTGNSAVKSATDSFVATGLALSHIDGISWHMHPTVFAISASCCLSGISIVPPQP
jgi:predicted glycoside hydrolase/deacetylase ChbG (UPF0249 family)